MNKLRCRIRAYAKKDLALALGLAPGESNIAAIQTAFHEASRIGHPDRPTGDVETFQLLQDAYSELMRIHVEGLELS